MLVQSGRLLTRWSSDKHNVVAKGQISSDATFTRADPATYFDSDGLMQTAAANEARTTYIDGVPYLWLDGAVTEISGKSNDFGTFTATIAKDAVGLDGESNSAFTITDDDAGTTEVAGHNVSITSSTSTYYLVVAFKKDDNPSVYPRFWPLMAGGTGNTIRVVADPSDGSLLNNGAVNGAIVLSQISQGDYWMCVLSVTDDDSGNTSIHIRVNPAFNEDGSNTGDAAAQGSNVFGYMGLFKDNFSLMPILTTGGTTKTIAADVASLANSVISGLTEGTLYMEIWTPQLTSNAARHIAELESDASNFIRVQHSADGDLDAQITDGGASQAALAGTDLTVGQLQKVALTFKEDEFSLYRGGSQLATDTSGTMPSVDTLLIGAGLYGGIRTLNVHTTAWSQAKAESETT